jgi:hypothetical protein
MERQKEMETGKCEKIHNLLNHMYVAKEKTNEKKLVKYEVGKFEKMEDFINIFKLSEKTTYYRKDYIPENFTFPLPKILEETDFKKYNMVIAGGAVCDYLIDNESVRDYDLFFYNSEKFEIQKNLINLIEIINKKERKYFNSNIKITVNNSIMEIFTNECKLKFFLKCHSSMAEILYDFDLGSCQVCYDGFNIYTTPLGEICFKYMVNFYEPFFIKSFNYGYRIKKYINKGFDKLIFSHYHYNLNSKIKYLESLSFLGLTIESIHFQNYNDNIVANYKNLKPNEIDFSYYSKNPQNFDEYFSFIDEFNTIDKNFEKFVIKHNIKMNINCEIKKIITGGKIDDNNIIQKIIEKPFHYETDLVNDDILVSCVDRGCMDLKKLNNILNEYPNKNEIIKHILCILQSYNENQLLKNEHINEVLESYNETIIRNIPFTERFSVSNNKNNLILSSEICYGLNNMIFYKPIYNRNNFLVIDENPSPISVVELDKIRTLENKNSEFTGPKWV